MLIHYFNPETEYALATGASFYTPPAIVETFKKEHQLLPLAYAKKGEFILIDSIDDIDTSRIGECSLIDWKMLPQLDTHASGIEIRPWGWNHALRRRLLDAGIPEIFLPSLNWVDRLRELAHRRTTITLNQRWNVGKTGIRVPLPLECFSVEECMEYLDSHPGCWMKAPWSSSGRGVINTAADMEPRHIRPWCHGIIRRQGSVLCEEAFPKSSDFATEWLISDGTPRFIGLSCFNTSNRGKYQGNVIQSQQTLTERFNQLSSISIEEVVETQRAILHQTLSGYEGPLGVDMMLDHEGNLRPFVEINLRHTMGMLTLL